jgi:hypothetical protein
MMDGLSINSKRRTNAAFLREIRRLIVRPLIRFHNRYTLRCAVLYFALQKGKQPPQRSASILFDSSDVHPAPTTSPAQVLAWLLMRRFQKFDRHGEAKK